MQVLCDEGVATHIGPEPCAGVREDAGEASAGEWASQPLSRGRKLIPGADAVCVAEGNMSRRVSASVWTAPRVKGFLECAAIVSGADMSSACWRGKITPLALMRIRFGSSPHQPHALLSAPCEKRAWEPVRSLTSPSGHPQPLFALQRNLFLPRPSRSGHDRAVVVDFARA